MNVKKSTAIDMYDTMRRDGIGENTISKAHKFLNETLEYAKERELIEENPLSRLKRADIPVEPQGTRGSLEAGEAKRIIRLVADEMSSGYHVAVFLALGYGLRRGECLGLTWENVNLSEDSPSIFIETQRTQYELAGTPKTEKSRRLIPIDESTREILSAWKKRQASLLEAAGAKQDGETRVCTSAEGKAIGVHKLERWWHKFCVDNAIRSGKDESTRSKWVDDDGREIVRAVVGSNPVDGAVMDWRLPNGWRCDSEGRRYCGKYKAPKITYHYRGAVFHQLRHTWASMRHDQGDPDRVLEYLGGWSSPAMPQRIYTHPLSESILNSSGFVDSLLLDGIKEQ